MNKNPDSNKQEYDVAIIGAGFAGLGAGIRLKQQGHSSFIIFERDSELSGTWRDNTYPGCACDIPSLLYSYSFEPNPEWSRAFSPQGEILDYLRLLKQTPDTASYFNLKPEVQKSLNEDIQQKLAKMVWSDGGCKSYYLQNHDGKNTSIWPGSTVTFRKKPKRST